MFFGGWKEEYSFLGREKTRVLKSLEGADL
jgi:hypothetical protein